MSISYVNAKGEQKEIPTPQIDACRDSEILRYIAQQAELQTADPAVAVMLLEVAVTELNYGIRRLVTVKGENGIERLQIAPVTETIL